MNREERRRIGTFTGPPRSPSRAGSRPAASSCAATSARWTNRLRLLGRAGVLDRIRLEIRPRPGRCGRCRGETIDPRSSTPTRSTTGRTTREVLARLRPNRLIVFDNVLWGGSVVDESNQEGRHDRDPGAERLRRVRPARRVRDGADRRRSAADPQRGRRGGPMIREGEQARRTSRHPRPTARPSLADFRGTGKPLILLSTRATTRAAPRKRAASATTPARSSRPARRSSASAWTRRTRTGSSSPTSA